MIEAGKCPRCLGVIPSPEHPGEWPGPLSRTDNATEICSACGVAEAQEDSGDGAASQKSWRAFSKTP